MTGSQALRTGSLRRPAGGRDDGDGARAGYGGGGRLTTGRRPRRPGRRIVVAALLRLAVTALSATPGG